MTKPRKKTALPKDRPDVPFLTIDTPRKRKKHAVLAAEMIVTSAAIDAEIGTLLAFLLGANASPVIAAYQEIRAERTKVAVVTAALGTVLSKDDSELLGDILAVASAAQKARHRVAHWLWSYAHGEPDAIHLWDPDLILQVWEKAHGLKEGQSLPGGTLRKPAAVIKLTLADMTHQRDQLTLGLMLLHSFRAIMTDEDGEAVALLRQRLLSAPPILERRASRERGRQKKQQEPRTPPPKSPKGSRSRASRRHRKTNSET